MKDTNSKQQVILLAIAACLIYGLTSGFRANYGIMLNALVSHTGVSYSDVSFVLAIGQLMVGIVQPIFGALALRKSNSFVLLTGLVTVIIGLILVPFSSNFILLLFSLGVLVSGGIGALSFGIIMGAVSPSISAKQSAMISGLVSASAGMGGIILSPGMEVAISSMGLPNMLRLFVLPLLLLLGAAVWVGKKEVSSVKEEEVGFLETLSLAFKDRNYLFIALAFFTCGFHMAIIETHLFSQYVSYGFDNRIIAFAFSVYGIAAMLGSIFYGSLMTVFRTKWVLASLYASRVLIPLLILVLPQSIILVYVTLFLLGFTGNATVPPTSGLISSLHGTKKLGVLFGIAYLAHQVGAFLSAWLGGLTLEMTHSYATIWLLSMLLSALATVLIALTKENGR